MTLASKITLLRVAFIPLYMVFMYLSGGESGLWMWLAFVIFILASLTDYVDGQIARKCNQVSDFGKFLDPLADKLTQFTLTICLAIRYPVLWIMVGLIFVKELFQLIAGIVAFRKGMMLKGALMSGKICTTVLFVSLIIMVLTPQAYLTDQVVLCVTIVDVTFLLIAFVDYALTYYKHKPILQKLNDQDQTP